MNVYRYLFRLRFIIQLKNNTNIFNKMAIPVSAVLTFFFSISQFAAFCYWIVCFLLAMSSLTTADHYLSTQLPISRHQIVRAHYLYCLTQDIFFWLLFYLLSRIDPLGIAPSNDALPLVLLFIISLPLYAVLLYLYYCGHKLTGLFSLLYYMSILLILKDLPIALSTWTIAFLLIAALLFYLTCCHLTCRYFAHKDLL